MAEAESPTLIPEGALRAMSIVVSLGSQFSQAQPAPADSDVVRPGAFVLLRACTLHDTLRAAAGLAFAAFFFGAELHRRSMCRGRQTNYDRAQRDVEVEFSRGSSAQRASTPDEAISQCNCAVSPHRLIEQPCALTTSGRVVLEPHSACQTNAFSQPFSSLNLVRNETEHGG